MSVAAQAQTTGLVGHWKFDEASGTAATDSSGRGNNGTLVNGPTRIAPGIHGGRALSFDGINDYVEIGDLPDLKITGALTISVWFNTTAPLGDYKTLVSKWSSGGTNASYDFGWTTNGLRFSIESNANQMLSVQTPVALNDGVWHQAVGTWDGSTIRLYVDGVLQAASSDPTFGLISDTTNPVRIATDNRYMDNANDRLFTGDIDEVRIYNRGLSSGEVSELYTLTNHWLADGDAADEAGSNNGTFSGTSFVTGKSGQAFNFTGGGNYVDAGPLDILNNTQHLTIAFWVNFNALSEFAGIVSKRFSDTNRVGISLDAAGRHGIDEGGLLLGNGANTFAYTGANIAQLNQWHHWAMVYDGTQPANDGRMKFYYDGTQLPLSFFGTIPDHTASNTNDFIMGKEPGFTTREMNGALDDVRIYDASLSGVQVARIAGVTLSSDASLSALTLGAGTLAPAFDGATTSYTATVPSNVTNVSPAATPADANASVVILGGSNLVAGANTITATVTAADGVTMKTYTIIVTRLASADLASLSISSGTLSPAFNANTTSYAATVANSVTNVSVTTTAVDPGATVGVTGGNNLAVGANPITIAVTASDGATSKSYTIAVTRQPSSDANLSAFSINPGTLSPAFTAATTSYTATVANAVTSTQVSATPANAAATVTFSGGGNLVVGPNTITAVVTAQDGTTQKTYTATVTRQPSSNANLAGLTLSAGVMVPAFQAGTTAYSAIVPNGVTSVNVTATTADATATLKVNAVAATSGVAKAMSLFAGANSISIAVTAQDTTTVKTYTVTVTRANPAPVISSLSPNMVFQNSGAFVLTVIGSNFVPGASVYWNNSIRNTIVVDANHLNVGINASDVTSVGPKTVVAMNPAPSDGASSLAQFSVEQQIVTPALTSIRPTSVFTGGSGFTLQVTGSQFRTNSVALWNGSALSTTYVSESQLTAAVPAADYATAGSANITVQTPGAAPSLPLGITLLSSANVTPAGPPKIGSITPSGMLYGGSPLTITIVGVNFIPSSTVRLNGNAIPSTTLNPNTIQATVTFVMLGRNSMGILNVVNGSPSFSSNFDFYGLSQFNINASAGSMPAPSMTSLSPQFVLAGGSVRTISVTGTGFQTTSTVNFNGVPRATVYRSSTLLEVTLLAGDIASAGSATITVNTVPPGGQSGGGLSGPATLSILATYPTPQILLVSPPTVPRGVGLSPFDLTVDGAGFTPISKLIVNGAAIPSSFVSDTRILGNTTTLGSGAHSVTVVTGNLASNAGTFAVAAPIKKPAKLSALIPLRISSTGTTTVTVHGTGFTPKTRVLVGKLIPGHTHFLSPTTLTVTVHGKPLPPGTQPVTTITPDTAGAPAVTLPVTVGGGGDGGAALSHRTILSIDTTPPTLDPITAGVQGDGGWYHTDVMVAWDGDDPESDVTYSDDCKTTTITTDTPPEGIKLNCTATSAGGFTTQSVTIKRDTQPPDIASVAKAGEDDYTPGMWSREAVTVSFTCSDSLSGIPNAICPSPVTVLGEGDGLTADGGNVCDTAGNCAAAIMSGIRIDMTPPLITTASDMTFTAAGASGAVVTYADATATDALSGVVGTPVCAPASGSLFPLGTTKVTCSVSDLAGNIGTATFNINVQSASAPVLSNVPDTTYAEALPGGVAVMYASPTATDTNGATVAVQCAPASGSVFSMGTTTVTCTATDGQQQTGIATFRVIVQDTTGPVLSGIPSNQTAEITSPDGNIITYDAPTAVDAIDGPVTVQCSQNAGAVFPLGDTDVVCRAADSSGNVSVATFRISIVDTTAPTLTVPPDIVAEATGPDGANVPFSASVNDASGTASDPVCAPASGQFPFGLTTVQCSTHDSSGNSSAGSFTVTVQDTIAPHVSCAAPDGLWHNGDVSIACTASDGGSGLANASDASFSLATSIAGGIETANASTASRVVCDLKGNCSTAGPISGNMIDRKPPSITFTVPSSGAAYTLGQSIAAAFTCSDGGSGVQSCTGTPANGSPLDTTTLGAKAVIVNASDNVGNTSSQSAAYNVTYAIALLFDNTKPVKGNATLAVKLAIENAARTNLSSPSIAVTATKVVRLSDGTATTPSDAGGSNPGNLFRFSDGNYIFNMKTAGLTSGNYALAFTVAGDPVAHSLTFTVQ